MTSYHPPASFFFSVSLFRDGEWSSDTSFQEVSGLQVEPQRVETIEGGDNRFVHQIPKPAKRSNLKLKRGITPANSEFVRRCKAVQEADPGRPIAPFDKIIHLLDSNGDPTMTWKLTKAWVVKWSTDHFDASKNTLALETVEICLRDP
ncbi:MAG: phage tail protein [Pseudomonadota bacterium]